MNPTRDSISDRARWGDERSRPPSSLLCPLSLVAIGVAAFVTTGCVSQQVAVRDTRITRPAALDAVKRAMSRHCIRSISGVEHRGTADEKGISYPYVVASGAPPGMGRILHKTEPYAAIKRVDVIYAWPLTIATVGFFTPLYATVRVVLQDGQVINGLDGSKERKQLDLLFPFWMFGGTHHVREAKATADSFLLMREANRGSGSGP